MITETSDPLDATSNQDTSTPDKPPEAELKTCEWVDPVTSECCLMQFHNTKKIANHVNRVHIEEGEGNEEQACHWLGCKRGHKPLRYKKVRRTFYLPFWLLT